MNLNKLMKQAQKMQEQMAKTQAELEKKTVEVSAAGGKVRVTANGAGDVIAIKIDKEVVDPNDVEFLAEIVTELHVGMRVGRGRKWNALLHRQLKDSVAWIKFVDRLTPASSGKFNPKVARTNEIERFADDCVNLRIWPMTMDFDEVEMSK